MVRTAVRRKLAGFLAGYRRLTVAAPVGRSRRCVLLRLAAVVSYDFGPSCDANSHGQDHDTRKDKRPHHDDKLSSPSYSTSKRKEAAMSDVTSIRDPQSDSLLTPQNAVLALIDYQREQYAGVGSVGH